MTPVTMHKGTAGESPDEIEMEASSPTLSLTGSSSRQGFTKEQLYGSSVTGAVFNFTNSIVGAGAIGLGGAIASSGGLVATFSIILFALLTKQSFDLVISLSINHTEGGSYEELGRSSYGNVGHHGVLISKFLYSFGCLVAYIVIIKDNFASALWHLIFYDENESTIHNNKMSSLLLEREDLVTWLVSAGVVLPLCLLRDMTPLEKASLIKIFAVVTILSIVIYLYIVNPNGTVRVTGGTTFDHWFQIRTGLMQSLGTFVFTFVSQHNVHQVYASLRPDIRNLNSFKQVSTWAVLLSTALSMGLGLFVYMTFWETATSAMFAMYPPNLPIIKVAQLLLCLMMMLTFPLPFFSCRELIILSITHSLFGQKEQNVRNSNKGERDTLLTKPPSEPGIFELQEKHWLLRGGYDMKQLHLPYHIMLTVALWGVPTFLAIAAPSLGDVLNLVGSATGTLIAFVLPALFTFRLEGYSQLAWLILVVGGVVGMVGTVYSIKQLVVDVATS